MSEQGHEIVFMYKIKPGRANKSYGINVAKLANLPESLLDRANEILTNLEKNSYQVNEVNVLSNDDQKHEPSMIEMYLDKIDRMSFVSIRCTINLN